MSDTQVPPVDVDVLRDEIQKTYTDVATDTGQEFIFPTGRSWAQELGYPEPELSRGVLLTAETDAAGALRAILAGEALADPRWDISQLLCKLRDAFKHH